MIRRGRIALGLSLALLALPTGAEAALRIDVVGSPSEVRTGETATFTATVTNTGPDSQPVEVGLLALRAGGEKAVSNRYQSVTATQGGCTIDEVRPPYNYTGADCQLGNVPAGGTAQITAVVQVNESMDQLTSILGAPGGGPITSDTARVRAIYPPRVEGSSKIKVRGLPGGCADGDLDLVAKAKGAKKVTASLSGPKDEWGNYLDGSSFSRKIAAEKDDRLKVEVPIGKERAGFYLLRFAARYENKPKQKTEITLQRCGVPEG
ncbi:MAG TPA: hypothetical protein VFY99_00775 [Solirubrobacterales bacterium]